MKVLYDAARYVELKDNKETARRRRLHRRDPDACLPGCAYKSDDPIKVQMEICSPSAGARRRPARPRPTAIGSR
ncbi:MAG: hypothetical protein WDN45_09590 [Caulobacteraceae bacterium]